MDCSDKEPTTLYHLLTAKHLSLIRRCDVYSPESLANEGFIHLAYAEQLGAIIKKYHSGAEDTYLLYIDSTKLQAEVIVESGSGNNLYPHLYGPLNTEAVYQIYKLTVDARGTYTGTLVP